MLRMKSTTSAPLAAPMQSAARARVLAEMEGSAIPGIEGHQYGRKALMLGNPAWEIGLS